MNRTVLSLLIAIVVIGAGWMWWSSQPSASARITVTSPAGGETWRPGEERTISWNARGVASTDKISITIRRIPPPPLQEEGQEFDPIIFTDLPNTGSATWKISPMYPDGTYVLEVHAYESIPITDEVSGESAPFAISHPRLNADLYPVYAGADWNASESETFPLGTTTYSGASITSSAVPSGMDPAGSFTPFEQYYDQKLKALGWSVANDLAAGGHVGGQTGYRKAGKIILARFHIDYHTTPQDAPSECPCDVTFSLFSEE